MPETTTARELYARMREREAMGESKHTPGPWRYVESEDRDGNRISYVSSQNHGYVPIRTPFRENAFHGNDRSDHAESEVDANAHLIAAAPDLLEAAQDALDRLAGVTGVPNPAAKLRAAIARAKGE